MSGIEGRAIEGPAVERPPVEALGADARSPELHRCTWCGTDPLYQAYHDREWGVPVRDGQELFERLVLEGMQAGLSWLTVLRKREAMTQAFWQFDVEQLAAARAEDYERWLANPALIRNRAKLAAVVTNAQAYRRLGGAKAFSQLLWGFVEHRVLINHWRRSADAPGQTPASQAMAKALKEAGFKFVGPTICYALMQSAGLVNDHETACFRHAEVV